MNGGANGARRIGAASDGPKRKVRFPKLKRDLLEWNSELFRRNLSESRVSAGPEIVSRALDGGTVVRAQNHFRGRAHFVGGIRRRSHPPTNEQITLPHRARLRISFGPAEFLRPELIRLLQMLGAERKIFRRMIIGVVC